MYLQFSRSPRHKKCGMMISEFRIMPLIFAHFKRLRGVVIGDWTRRTSGSFNPASLNGAGSSILTICAAASAPLGSQALTITGSYGAEVHSLSVTLAVNPPPNFTLTASPSGQSVIAGNSANFTVATGSVSGFAGNVALSISGLPAGAVATFSPVTVAPGSSSTLHISTSTGTPLGSYSLVITGVSGLSHSTTVVLGVTAPPPPPCTRPPCRVQN